MTDGGLSGGTPISPFALGTLLLRNRWRIVRWMLLCAFLAAVSVSFKAPSYVAMASFTLQGSDPGRSQLASLAGQFGVALPGTSQSLSPDFYAKLVKSRVLLRPITRDTFTVQELNGKRVSFQDLLELDAPTVRDREDQGIGRLGQMVAASVVKTTGVVELSVASRWPSVSLAIVTEVVNGVNEFNQRTRQGQAGAERRFLEGRLAVAGSDLKESEDRLERFLVANRDFANSPALAFARDRLGRDVALRQQVVNSLTQAYEDARIREVRDTPVITVVESPSVPSSPRSVRRNLRVALGLMFGGFVGAVLVVLSGAVARRREEGDAEAIEFMAALGEVKSEIVGHVRGLSRVFRRRAGGAR